jgi:pimeloyl-ACP methyl ester carboxylesterase
VNAPLNVAEARSFAVAAGRRLEYRWFGEPAADAVVLLHEGLGSVAHWRDFPQRLADATRRPVLVYSRCGNGWSEPLHKPRRTDYMHDEATGALPDLLQALGIERPLLVGHSDGASIALIHGARFPSAATGVVALAPHLFVEPLTLASIADIAARFDDSDLPVRMRRYHADPVATFRGWADVWLDPAFPGWNIEAEVAATCCPILAMQGAEDEYGTMRQVRRIAELRPGTRVVELPCCRHSPHVDAPDRVLEEISGFAACLN